MEVTLHKDSVGEFCCVGSIFSMKLLGFVSKAIQLLLTELVGQCKNILPLAFFRIDLPSVGQYGKGCGQYIPALTSHSVNKSIIYSSLFMQNKNMAARWLLKLLKASENQTQKSIHYI